MAELFTEDFEGGPSGAAATTSNTSADSINGTPTLSDLQSVTGSQSLRCQASSSREAVEFHFAATGEAYARTYARFTDMGNSRYFFTALNGTTQVANIRTNDDGSISVRNQFMAVWTSTAGGFGAGEWIRVEWHLDGGTGQRVRLFYGSNLHGTTPDEDSGVVALTQSAFDRIIVGFNTSVTAEGFFDAAAADDADWVGPAVDPPTSSQPVFRISGGQLVPMTVTML